MRTMLPRRLSSPAVSAQSTSTIVRHVSAACPITAVMFSEPSPNPFLQALTEGWAGIIELDLDDDPLLTHLSLQEAAHALGVRVISGWIGSGHDLLAWRRSTNEPADSVILAVWSDLVV